MLTEQYFYYVRGCTVRTMYISTMYYVMCTGTLSRVIELLRNIEFRNWHAMRGGLMLSDSISEEKLEID